jgi:hypothetical protein
MWSRGPWAPALIWLSPARDPETGQAMDRAPAMLCLKNGEERSPYDVHTYLHPCSREEYEALCRVHEGRCERVVEAMMENSLADQ